MYHSFPKNSLDEIIPPVRHLNFIFLSIASLHASQWRYYLRDIPFPTVEIPDRHVPAQWIRSSIRRKICGLDSRGLRNGKTGGGEKERLDSNEKWYIPLLFRRTNIYIKMKIVVIHSHSISKWHSVLSKGGSVPKSSFIHFSSVGFIYFKICFWLMISLQMRLCKRRYTYYIDIGFTNISFMPQKAELRSFSWKFWERHTKNISSEQTSKNILIYTFLPSTS